MSKIQENMPNFSFTYTNETELHKLRKWHKGLTSKEAILEAFQIYPVIEEYDDLNLFHNVSSIDELKERIQFYSSLDEAGPIKNEYCTLIAKAEMYVKRYPESFFSNMHEALENKHQLELFESYLVSDANNFKIEFHCDYSFTPTKEQLENPEFKDNVPTENYYDIESLKSWFGEYIQPPKHWENSKEYMKSPFSSSYETTKVGRKTQKKTNTLYTLLISAMLLALGRKIKNCFHENGEINKKEFSKIIKDKLPDLFNNAMELGAIGEDSLIKYISQAVDHVHKDFHESEEGETLTFKEYIFRELKLKD